MTVGLQELRALGALSDLDVHFASAIARLAGERDQRVLLAAALCSQKVQAGHVCLDLPALCRDETTLDTDEGPRAVTWPEPEAWLAALRASPLTAQPPSVGGVAPLHVDGAGRLYLQRYYQHEQRLARSILERVQRPLPDIDRARLQSGLDRLFWSAPPSGRPRAQLDLFAAEPDDQRLAAQRAVERAFCVISGGPGTGKTSTVVKILLLLAEQARARAEPMPRMLLLAPTGKAAARLSEAVQRAKGSLAADAAVLAAIPEEASTIHRALGVFGGHAPRFRHHRDAPLAADAVVVDEASMVDLALMSRLLEAVPASARVLLLGDKDQLASVEAGAVLGDICGAGLPDSARAESSVAPIAGSIALLTHSYRYAADSGIQALAEAINGADAERALAILRDSDLPDVALVEPASSDALPSRLWADAVAGFGPLLRAPDAAGKLQALERFAVLCAHRRGPFGQLAINRRIEAALRDAGLLTSTTASYPGRPVIVTQNDYQARLFNGEVGVLLRDTAREPGSQARMLAHFSASGRGGAPALRRAEGQGGKLREVAAARLPPHESAYALSVHKSQGSEFDEVAVVLPGEASPVLSRELLYTAVTRARKRVVVYASAEIAALCVRRTVRRASGLRDALWDSTR
jgi:exodeoxyribonuclease V alpha subunit